MPIRAALVLASATLLAQGSTLRWSPKENDTMRFRTTGDFTMGGAQISMTALNEQKVIRVDPDGGFLVQSTPIDAKVTMAGQEMSGKGVTTMTTYLPTGEIKEIRGDQADATGYRMANLVGFHAPAKAVAVGDAWTAEGKGNPATGAVSWKADYKVVAEESVTDAGGQPVGPFPALKIEVSARETEGASAGKTTGSLWVGKDGVTVRSELTWTNIAAPGASAAVNGKYTLARVQ